MGGTKQNEDLLLTNMVISVTLSKESMGYNHLEVSEKWVVDFVGQLSKWARAPSTCDITPKFIYLIPYKKDYRESRHNIKATLKT